MGIKIKVSEISKLIIYYILIINTCCDINLINCDIHKMRQKHIDGLAAMTDSNSISENEVDFKINATELEHHIMSGLNMTKKPDAEMVSNRKMKINFKTKMFCKRKKDVRLYKLQHIEMSFLNLIVDLPVGTNLSSTLNVVDVRRSGN